MKKEIENWAKTADIANKYGKDGCISPLKEAIDNLLKSEKEKNYQRFIEILEELNKFVETESGKSGRKEILQKIQEVIKQLKDKK